ncbi:DUF2280 domain-containing protein [Janthinobacterium sp. SUN073]|uniref:DUF2280 domain-containing protein n=1 Tax=Janthinobacterium sp. SUN073 TaxID=3004102 RepID=UPI0025AF1A07|nr:DUF2280 domain-containing protein [Janthinobacterium sp. SUN073]MDN2697155.1 DUF2280 domain-containing protein [Janthinobacterium sp. SUN073]
MAALKDEVKLFIVNALACFDAPTQVSIAVKEEFGLDVSRQQVSCYDPNTYVGRNLSQKWRTIFEETRAKFRATAEEIPIASKAFRLRGLGRLAQKAENMRNLPLVASLYEQAAKEVGDIFVNKGKAEQADQAPTPVAITFGVKDAKRHDDNPV